MTPILLTASQARTRPLAGTGTLIRFMLRRDRMRIPLWVGAISLFNVTTAANLPNTYQTVEDRHSRAELVENPGIRMLSGPGYGLDDYTFGAMLANENLSTAGTFVALMAILLMVRHTRAEEETGRAELVRSAVVGRHAAITAALTVVCGATIAAGVVSALGLGAAEIQTIDWRGSLLYGAALASIGVVFAAVTAVTAQLTAYARGAGGMAGAALGAAFVLRGVGDAVQLGGGPMSWLSPMGWAQQTRAYVDNRWWPLLLPVALAAGLVVLAFWLGTRRDTGAGLLASRPGASAGSKGLAGPLGLAWRQHRASVLWWSGAMFATGLFYGTLATEFETFVDESGSLSDWMEQIGGETVLDSWLAALVQMMAVAISVFGVLAVLRPRSEETSGRAEPVLAAAASRARWVGSHLAVALVGSLFILALAGLGLGLTTAATLDDAGAVARIVGAALAYTPAVWLTVGFGVALFGLIPRASAAVWLVVAYAGVVGILGAFLGLPDRLVNLSPFAQVPMLPADAMNWSSLLGLTAIAAVLVAAGLTGFRRRDLESK